MGVVVRRYIDFLILLIPTPLVYICSFLYIAASLLFVHLKKNFFVLVPVLVCNYILCINICTCTYAYSCSHLLSPTCYRKS